MNAHAAKIVMSMSYAVYREPKGELLAVLRHAEDAAALVSVTGGVVVLHLPDGLCPSAVLWTESAPGEPGDGEASESYDLAADKMREREREFELAHPTACRACITHARNFPGERCPACAHDAAKAKARAAREVRS